MIKIFDIPIYALSRKQLQKKYDKYMDKQAKIFQLDCESDVNTNYNYIYPANCWQFNHIVGYISISCDEKNLDIKLYLPYKPLERYIWHSKQKILLRDSMLNGQHIYIPNYRTNEEILARLDDMLTDIICNNVPSRFFVDTEIYENIKGMIDFQNIN